MDTFYQQAYSLISSPKAKEAFNINAEDAKLRDAYGRNAAGQRMLMARRLVEAGVRLVSLTYGGWDMHGQIKQGIQGQLPQFDQAFATLITDLSQRGLLDSTLIIVLSEFGRTPNINQYYGRDHWSRAWSVVMAGGNTIRGAVYGKTNANGTAVEEGQVDHGNLFHTYLSAVGLESSGSFDIDGREMPMADPASHLIQEVLA